MYRDPTEFRQRFLAYKEGKTPYENGLPKYAEGTPSYDSTIDFLKRYEGFKDTTYLDGNGIPTIGYGFTDSSLVDKGTISRAEADRRLKQEVASREKFLSKMKNWDKLSEDSKTALRSYYYNYPAGFKPTTKFMKAWNAGDYEEAIRQVDAGMYDKKNPGLRKRRLEEQALLKVDPFLRPVLTIQPTPIVNPAISTAVRLTIPEEAVVPDPYVPNRRTVRLLPPVKLPNLIEMLEDLEWLPNTGFKNGKLPRFGEGKEGDKQLAEEKDLMWYAKPFVWKYLTDGLPVNTVRERLYNNLVPVLYKTNKYPWTRVRDAVVNNEKESFDYFDDRQKAGALARDEIYALYLHIPKNKRRNIGFELEDSKYRPTLNDKGEHFYSINFGEDADKIKGAIINNAMKTSAVLDDGIDADGYSDFYNVPGLLPNQVKPSVVLNDLLGWHRVGRGIDPKKGDYISYWDRWDLTPVGRTGGDLSMGIGTPVNIYDRIYLDDYYGVNSAPPAGTYYGGYLPEIEVLPKHNNGKLSAYKNGKSSIHINPANRGKFNATKKRTGKTTEELAHSKNPLTRKRAIFALNARKWKH